MMVGNGSIMRTRRAEPGLAASKGLGLAAWIRALFVCVLAGSLAFSTTLPAVAAGKQKQSDAHQKRDAKHSSRRRMPPEHQHRQDSAK